MSNTAGEYDPVYVLKRHPLFCVWKPVVLESRRPPTDLELSGCSPQHAKIEITLKYKLRKVPRKSIKKLIPGGKLLE